MKSPLFISLILSLLFLSSCGDSAPKYSSIDGFIQGTTFHIVVEYDDIKGLKSAIDSIFTQIDNSLSLYNSNSLLSRINSGELDSVDIHIERCIEVSERISRESDGAYDITIKPITEAWGFIGQNQVETPNIDSLMQYVDYTGIKVENGRLIKRCPQMEIDLNATAQGYTVDVIGAMLSSLNIENYIVEVGGEIICKGVNARGKAWTIGVDKPIEGNFTPGNTLQSTIELEDRALATSGNYRKFHVDESGRKIVHTIDAKTGYSKISNLLSVTVVAESALLADGYSTMMMILGVEKSKSFLQKRSDLEALLVYSDHTDTLRTYCSPTLKIKEIE